MTAADLERNIVRAAELLREAEAVFIGAGAGMGVDSGLPDFRGPEGFWHAYPAFQRRKLNFESMADPDWFYRDPRLAWAFYGHRLNLYRRTEPHSGFHVLRQLAENKPFSGFVFTSNVDGQFQKAGFAPSQILECHGSIHHLQCARPCTRELWSADGTHLEVDGDAFLALGELPACVHFGKIARPNILMFGDFRWVGDRSETQEVGRRNWMLRVEGLARRTAVIELGAGTGIPTVRYACERAAEALRATLIRINIREPQVPPGHVSLPLGAAEAMRRIQERLCD